MTRREKLERRLELRRAWAEKRRQRSTEAYEKSRDILAPIPFGQSILVGHHSEKSHRSTLQRAHNAMDKSCECSAMAKHHEQKADGIEGQLERCIFSDDADAIEKLEAKIEDAERMQEAMAAANKIIRKKPKNEPSAEKIAALVALGMKESRAAELFQPDFCGRIGFASYALTNNNANIRRMKERIQQIKTRRQRTEAAESNGGILIEGNTEYVRITFAEKPERAVLNSLKAANFRWSGGAWFGKREAIPTDVKEGSNA